MDKKPRIQGINGFCNFSFLDKKAGKRDAQENQICEHGEEHITPHIDDKVRLLDSYIDKMYVKISLNLEPLVTEANSLVVEFNLNQGNKVMSVVGNGENGSVRASAMEDRK